MCAFITGVERMEKNLQDEIPAFALLEMQSV